MSNNEASAVKITKNSSLKGLTTCTHTHGHLAVQHFQCSVRGSFQSGDNHLHS